MNPKIQRDLKRCVGGRQFEGGNGVPDRKRDEQGSLLGLLPTPRLLQSLPPRAGSGRPGRSSLEETVFRRLELGLRGWGPGRGRRAANLQIGLGSVGVRGTGGLREPGRGAGPRSGGTGSCPHGGRPASLHHQERAGFWARAPFPRKEGPGSSTPYLATLSGILTPAGSGFHLGQGWGRGRALGRGPGPRSPGRQLGRAGPALGGAAGPGGHRGPPS